MSRPVAAQKAPHENFAGLFERLSRNNSEGSATPFSAPHLESDLDLELGPDSELSPDFESGPEQGFYSGSRTVSTPGAAAASSQSSRTPAKRTLAPLNSSSNNTKTQGKKPASSSKELSYEKALRLHGRHHLDTDNDLDFAAVAKVGGEPKRPETPASSAKKSLPQKNVAKSAGDLPSLKDVTPDRSRRSAASTVNPPAGNPAQSAAPAASATKAKYDKQRRKEHPGDYNGAVNRPLQAKIALPVPSPGEQAETQLEILSRNTQLDQRRVILSVRLSKEEVELLRERAAEAGISASAYMRSCVLDADHLRSQVKQALAEMRAFSRPEEDSRRSAPHRSGQGPVHMPPISGGVWFRMLTKSAAFFLGPLFPDRHRA